MDLEERGPDRRIENRRDDPNVWSAGHKKQVSFVYGLVVGGILMFAGLVIIVWAVTNETVNNLTAGLGMGLILIGGVASMPQYFMPLISAGLKKIPWGRNGSNGTITKVLPAIVDELESEDEG